MYCTKCDTPNADNAKVCKACGAPLPKPVSVTYNPGENCHVPDYPMKWYNFLIYFQLFAAGAVNIISGIAYLVKAVSGFGMFLALLGIFSFFMGGYAIYIRFALADYRRTGLTHYKAYMILVLLLQVTASLLTSGISGALGSLIGQGIYVALNFTYFNKREELFVY